MITYKCRQGRGLYMMNGLKKLVKARQYRKEVKKIITMQKKAINELETLNKNLKLINQNY